MKEPRRLNRILEGALRCNHIFHRTLLCDGSEHYYPCIRRGCNERFYFCKHTNDDDRHCPRNQ